MEVSEIKSGLISVSVLRWRSVSPSSDICRGAVPPCAFDRILSTRFGVAAVDLIASKRFGEMVCLKGQRIESVSLNEVAKGQKKVPTEEGLVKTAESIGISFGR